jgi:hypothetical protein
MNASIKSKDDFKDESLGKTYCVDSDTLTIQRSGKNLLIIAKESEHYTPQDDIAVTPSRYIRRKLRLVLTPENLKQILDAAIKANLLEAEFSVKKTNKETK